MNIIVYIVLLITMLLIGAALGAYVQKRRTIADIVRRTMMDVYFIVDRVMERTDITEITDENKSELICCLMDELTYYIKGIERHDPDDFEK